MWLVVHVKETSARFGRDMFSAVQKPANEQRPVIAQGDNLALMKRLLLCYWETEGKMKSMTNWNSWSYNDWYVMSKRNRTSFLCWEQVDTYQRCRFCWLRRLLLCANTMRPLWLSCRLINSANLQFELDLLDGRNEGKPSKWFRPVPCRKYWAIFIEHLINYSYSWPDEVVYLFI